MVAAQRLSTTAITWQAEQLLTTELDRMDAHQVGISLHLLS